MLWFYRRTFLMLLVVACALAVIRLVGSSRPLPLGILFTNPDGSVCKQPCVAGIIPGETRLPDVLTLLKSHPLTRGFASAGRSSQTRVTLTQGLSDVRLASAPDGSVDSILVLLTPATDPRDS